MRDEDFDSLVALLKRIPAISGSIGTGYFDNGLWWAKFTIDINHPLAWNVVQELGHVLNYGSLNEQLPTVFKPISPPPYMNGGPGKFLSWVIESTAEDFSQNDAEEWLSGRLPKPVEDEHEWAND